MMRNLGTFALAVALLISVAWAQDDKAAKDAKSKAEAAQKEAKKAADKVKKKADDAKAKADDAKKKAEGKADDAKKKADKKDEPKPETKDEPTPKTLTEEDKQAIADFQKRQVEWKNLLGELRALQKEYSFAKSDEDRDGIEKKYNALIAKGEALETKVKSAAEGAYLADPKLQRDAERFLASSAAANYQRDNYEEAARLAVLLADSGYQNSMIYRIAGNASFHTAKFEDAEKYLTLAKDYGSLDEEGTQHLADISRYKTYWATEQEIRLKEAEADDLPRVVLKTNKGDIVIELFENEAPNTVANFITLIEKDYYKNIPFHRVLSGFMAQGGCPKGDGTGGPGYNIPDECYQENYRRHFRGSLSMAKSVGRDTGGSQFFLCYKPTGHLDGKHTVFGRIVEGLDIATDLRRIDPSQPSPGVVPDKILEAKVLRKREHEYKFRKTGEEDPADKKDDADKKKDDGKKGDAGKKKDGDAKKDGDKKASGDAKKDAAKDKKEADAKPKNDGEKKPAKESKDKKDE